MKKVFSLFVFIISLSIEIYAQKIDSIKAMPNKYIWGEATSDRKKIADQNAMAELISQISTTVNSKFSLLKKETIKNSRIRYKEVYNSTINSYSNATLKNTNRIIVENKGLITVFRYIERAEIKRIFDEREHKIRHYINNAENYLIENKVSDALRYYYWALILLQSHPEGGNLTIIDQNEHEQKLALWLPVKINEVFEGITFDFVKDLKTFDSRNVVLLIKYHGKAVSNFDYKYKRSRRWSKNILTRDGVAHLRLTGSAMSSDKIQFQAIYLYKKETYSDKELKGLLSKLPDIEFHKSLYTVYDSEVLDHEEVKLYADYVGSKLMSCCSGSGGNNLSTSVNWGHDYYGNPYTHYNNKKDMIIIKMVVRWQGSVTGFSYSITGVLTVNLKTGKKSWVKESDSGWFPPNCGTNCNVN
ncbi:MAG: LPP20 family lipoprotein [Bacteroidales bacterium]|nr:LPP20 family lipoprotein [Bacteroidales bacterium]